MYATGNHTAAVTATQKHISKYGHNMRKCAVLHNRPAKTQISLHIYAV